MNIIHFQEPKCKTCMGFGFIRENDWEFSCPDCLGEGDSRPDEERDFDSLAAMLARYEEGLEEAA